MKGRAEDAYARNSLQTGRRGNMKPFIPEFVFPNCYFLYEDRGTDSTAIKKKASLTLHYGNPTLYELNFPEIIGLHIWEAPCVLSWKMNKSIMNL